MSVTVLSLPEREANSAASFSDSMSRCSSRAWKMQRVFFQKDHADTCPGLVKVDFYGDGNPLSHER